MRLPTTRLLSLLSLLALVPIGVYTVANGAYVVVLSLVSIVLIAASLAVMFGPAERPAIAH